MTAIQRPRIKTQDWLLMANRGRVHFVILREIFAQFSGPLVLPRLNQERFETRQNLLISVPPLGFLAQRRVGLFSAPCWLESRLVAEGTWLFAFVR